MLFRTLEPYYNAKLFHTCYVYHITNLVIQNGLKLIQEQLEKIRYSKLILFILLVLKKKISIKNSKAIELSPKFFVDT